MESHTSDHRHILSLHSFLQKTKKTSFFAFLSILLFLLLSYNGACIFSVHLSFPSKFHPETFAGKSRIWVPVSSTTPTTTKLASFKLYAVKEENPQTISMTHLPLLRKSHSYALQNRPESATAAGESRKYVSPPSSTIMKPVQQENPPPISRNSRSFSLLDDNSPPFSPIQRRENKQVIKNLQLGAQTEKFAAKLKDFFGNNSMNFHCEIRFFMTWISSLDSFSDREILSIETLFNAHPNGCLVIVSNSLDSIEGMQVLRPFLDEGFKITAISPDFNYLFENTVAESWFDRLVNGSVDPGEVSLGQNLSNLLRLALLYKFGGVYIDTDIIVLKSFGKLRNAIGAQTIDQETKKWSRLNNAVMVFDKGHTLLYKFIQEFALTFDGTKWGHNGPYLVSRVVSRVSGRPGFNFTILPPNAFYPVNWSKVRNLFRAPRNGSDSKWLNSKLKQIQSESYSVHLWNKQSRGLKAQEGSIVRKIMSDYCIFCNSSASAL